MGNENLNINELLTQKPLTDIEFQETITDWMQDNILSEAIGQSYNEIKKQYNNTLIPIMSIPKTNPIFKGIYKEAINNNVYCGKAFFINHAVNHHPEMTKEDYLKMPQILSNPDIMYYDNKNDSLIFIKEINSKKDILAVRLDNNKLILNKTNYISHKKLPQRWQEVSMMDGLPIISHSLLKEPGSARNISALNETILTNDNIPQSQKLSSNKKDNKEINMENKEIYTPLNELIIGDKEKILDNFIDKYLENKNKTITLYRDRTDEAPLEIKTIREILNSNEPREYFENLVIEWYDNARNISYIELADKVIQNIKENFNNNEELSKEIKEEISGYIDTNVECIFPFDEYEKDTYKTDVYLDKDNNLKYKLDNEEDVTLEFQSTDYNKVDLTLDELIQIEEAQRNPELIKNTPIIKELTDNLITKNNIVNNENNKKINIEDTFVHNASEIITNDCSINYKTKTVNGKEVYYIDVDVGNDKPIHFETDNLDNMDTIYDKVFTLDPHVYERAIIQRLNDHDKEITNDDIFEMKSFGGMQPLWKNENDINIIQAAYNRNDSDNNRHGTLARMIDTFGEDWENIIDEIDNTLAENRHIFNANNVIVTDNKNEEDVGLNWNGINYRMLDYIEFDIGENQLLYCEKGSGEHTSDPPFTLSIGESLDNAINIIAERENIYPDINNVIEEYDPDKTGEEYYKDIILNGERPQIIGFENESDIEKFIIDTFDPHLYKRAFNQMIRDDIGTKDDIKKFLESKYIEGVLKTDYAEWKDENGKCAFDYDTGARDRLIEIYQEYGIAGEVKEIKAKIQEKVSPTLGQIIPNQENTEKSFEQQIKEVKAGTYDVHSALKVCDTPQILLDVGCDRLPMLYTQKHLKNALTNTNDTHTHNLDEETIKMMPKLLKEPTMIFDSLTKNDSLIVATDKLDKENKPIIISVKPNGKGIYELETIDSNFITSIYGKKNFADFIEKTTNENKMLYWDKQKSQDLFRLVRLQLPQCLNNLDSDIILHQSEAIVKQKNTQNIENNTDSQNLSQEDYEYIYSKDFIEKFGDWEKAKRLEKLKNAQPIIENGKIIIDNEDITEDINNFRKNNNLKIMRVFAKEVGKQISGKYHNDDMNTDINVTMSNIDEIKNHHMGVAGHFEAIQYIPKIIENGIFITEEKNEDKQKHPNIEKYQYLLTGIKIADTDYTCKSVISVDKDGNRYYDQRLSQIEKGLLLDNLSQLVSRGKSTQSLDNYDKRILKICQVVQQNYLDKNLEPTKETIQAVKNGYLYVEKDKDNFEILHDKTQEKEIIIGQKLKDIILNKSKETITQQKNAPSLYEHLSQKYPNEAWDKDAIDTVEYWAEKGGIDKSDYEKVKISEITDTATQALKMELSQSNDYTPSEITQRIEWADKLNDKCDKLDHPTPKHEMPNEIKPSEKENCENYINIENAKLIINAINNNNILISRYPGRKLPDGQCLIDYHRIYNADTGKTVNAENLLALQAQAATNNNKDTNCNTVGSSATIYKIGAQIKENEHGHFNTFTDSNNNTHAIVYFNDNQLENPQVLKEEFEKNCNKQEMLNKINTLPNNIDQFVIENKKDFLPIYIAAHDGTIGSRPIITTNKILKDIRNDIKNTCQNIVDQKIPSTTLNTILRNAEKDSQKIINHIVNEHEKERKLDNGLVQEPKTHKQKNYAIER